MLAMICRWLLLLSDLSWPTGSESWPSGSLSKAPFEWRCVEPDDEAMDPPLTRELFPGDSGQEEDRARIQDSFPAGVLSDSPRRFLQAEPPVFQGAFLPHDSFGGFFRSHGSSDAWKDYVWRDYLSQPAVLLPIGLALSAVAISHWDRRLERQWKGVLGGRQSLSNIGVYTILGASVLIGVAMPGEGRTSWDEFWTMAEAYAASTLTSTVMKYGVARYRPGHGTHSFPSGHAAIAFTGATLIERNSGELWGIPAYALAAFTGFERVEAGRHFPSDVLVGAAVGVLSAGIVDALHWGAGPGSGGIARPRLTCNVEMDGLRGGLLQIAIAF